MSDAAVSFSDIAVRKYHLPVDRRGADARTPHGGRTYTARRTHVRRAADDGKA